jgi:peroxiredoxin Q/BCP
MAKKKAKASKKSTSKARKKVKKTAKKARKPAKKAARKPVKKATRKAPQKAARKIVKAARRKAPAKPKAAKRPAKPKLAVPPPFVAPAPVITPPPPTPAPAPAAPKPRPERGPRFFEPDELAGGEPSVEGPLFGDDRRDRPFYDTEVDKLDDEVDVDEGEGTSADASLDDEGESEEEDDDEALPPRERPPPGGATTRVPASARATEVKVDAGDPAPAFALRDETGRMHSLSAYRGQTVVLYFYPRDSTPGCTREACGFRDSLGQFTDREAVVLGVSPDSAASHASFVKKYSLTFPLLTDANHAVAERYGAWGEKPGPGGPRLGILRTTFVIDEAGRIAQVFRNVRADGHEQQVLDWLDQKRLASH